jgi:sugar phosphate isomerase/epimerase
MSHGASLRLARGRALQLEVEERMVSRRDLAKMALGALPGVGLLAKPNSVVRGVTIGICTDSFRDRSLDAALEAIADIGISFCELWEGHMIPQALNRKGQREWRESIAIEQYTAARQKFTNAGVKIYAFNYNFADDFTDQEIARGFEMAKALGAAVITASSRGEVLRRINPYAEKNGMVVALTNDDGEFSTPQAFDAAMRGNSHIRMALDIGDLVVAGFDPVRYVADRGNLIAVLHIQDRRKSGGPPLAFGQGDVPIGQVLQMLTSGRPAIPAMIRCNYGGDDVTEARRCYAYCRDVLRKK